MFQPPFQGESGASEYIAWNWNSYFSRQRVGDVDEDAVLINESINDLGGLAKPGKVVGSGAAISSSGVKEGPRRSVKNLDGVVEGQASFRASSRGPPQGDEKKGGPGNQPNSGRSRNEVVGLPVTSRLPHGSEVTKVDISVPH